MAKRAKALTIHAADTGNGTPIDVSDLTGIYVSVVSIGTASYKVMASFDGGVSFAQIGATLTADGTVTVPDAATQVRVDCSAYTSGTAKAACSGVVA